MKHSFFSILGAIFFLGLLHLGQASAGDSAAPTGGTASPTVAITSSTGADTCRKAGTALDFNSPFVAVHYAHNEECTNAIAHPSPVLEPKCCSGKGTPTLTCVAQGTGFDAIYSHVLCL